MCVRVRVCVCVSARASECFGNDRWEMGEGEDWCYPYLQLKRALSADVCMLVRCVRSFVRACVRACVRVCACVCVCM